MKKLFNMFQGATAQVQLIIFTVMSLLMVLGSIAIFRDAWWLVLVGVLVVAAALLIYWLVLKSIRRKKAKGMEGAIQANSSLEPGPAAPTGVEEQAKLKQIRKKFEFALEVYRTAGKDLYTLPWYVMVGEPGSGKSEAIRKSSIPFSAGLQDEQQGVGGTIDMDWWFTNHAVILDTAGKMMFEQAKVGGGTQWKEFLSLLKKHRPHCPINGMLLVIPVDSLLNDSDEKAAQKINDITTQFKLIQDTLDVRFPLYVIVNKCDMMMGFRPFFEGVSNANNPHQMLGWSNPNDLDQPFDPAQLDAHLKEVQSRLERRRLGLIRDPIPTEGDSDTRLDEVDEMYVFPDSFMTIAPRLKQYLNTIFVQGALGAAPLFLRGIYFTSAIEKGEALDKELASVLNAPNSAPQAGKQWVRERAYFLKDLFTEKAFKERSLVTRATNTKELTTRRKQLLLGSAVAGVVFLILLTWIGARGLKQSIGVESDRWAAVSRLFTDAQQSPRIVDRVDGKYVYEGARATPFAGESRRAVELPGLTLEMAQRRIAVPWIFRLTSGLRGNLLANKRLAAHAAGLESAAIKPLTDAAFERIAANDSKWTPAATTALATLLRMETTARGYTPAGPTPAVIVHRLSGETASSTTSASIGHSPAAASAADTAAATTDAGEDQAAAGQARTIDLQTLAAFVFLSKEAIDYRADQPALQATVDATYDPDTSLWPPAFYALDLYRPASEQTHQSLDRGVSRFLGQQNSNKRQMLDEPHYLALTGLWDALGRFRRSEVDLLKLDDNYPNPGDEPAQYAAFEIDYARWATAYGALDLAAKDASRALQEVVQLGGTPNDIRAFVDVAAKAADVELNRVFAELVNQLPDVDSDDSTGDPTLDDLRSRLIMGKATAATSLESMLSEIRGDIGWMELLLAQDTSMRARSTEPNRPYQIRRAMYAAAHAALTTTDDILPAVLRGEAATESSDLSSLDPFAAIDANLQAAQATIAKHASADAGSPQAAEGRAVCQYILRLAGRNRRYSIAMTMLGSAGVPQTLEDIEERLKSLGVSARVALDLPLVTLSRSLADDIAVKTANLGHLQHHPKIYGPYAAVWAKMSGSLIEQQDGAWQVLEADQIRTKVQDARQLFREYNDRYIQFWTAEVESLASPRLTGVWKSEVTFGELDRVRRTIVRRQLAQLTVLQKSALQAAPDRDDPRIVQALHHLELRETMFQNREHADRVTETNANWARLRATPDTAVTIVGELTKYDFESTYMPIELMGDSVEPAPVFYWRELYIEQIRLLADYAEKDMVTARNTLRNDYKRFPLCRGLGDDATADPLTKAQVQEALLLARRALPGGSRTASAATIAGGANTLYPNANRHLARLRGEGATRGEAEQKWLTDVANLLEKLSRGSTVKMFIPSHTVQITRPNWDLNSDTAARVFEVGQIRMPPSLEEDFARNAATPLGKITMPTSSDMTVRMAVNRDGPYTSQTELKAPWPALHAILRHGSLDPTMTNEPGVWRVPLLVLKDGDRYHLWIEFQDFSPELPPLEDWPDSNTWP